LPFPFPSGGRPRYSLMRHNYQSIQLDSYYAILIYAL
jgi:hypothetical protein